MPVNEFEKQVQQKMNELQLRPSDEVWEEVEKRIRREKKRRRFIIWFFLLGPLLLGGTAWWIASENKKNAPVNYSVTKSTADKKINELNTGIRSNIKTETVPVKKDDSSYQDKNEKAEAGSPYNLTITNTEVEPVKKIARPARIENLFHTETDKDNSAPEPLKNKKTNKISPGLPVITNNDQPMVMEKIDSADNSKTSDPIVKAEINTFIKDSVETNKNIVQNDAVATKQEIISVVKDSLVTDQIEESDEKNKIKIKKNKWEFGITAMVGVSGKSEGISIFDGQKSYSSSNLLAANPGPATPQITTVTKPESGFSWQVGASAKRKLTERTGVSVGLNFSSYSTVQRTGAFVDSSRVFSYRSYSSSVNNFYRNGAGDTYKNHYYFLELPFSFHWQINKGMKLPLVFQTGFSTGLFTGNDALIYNSASDVFYRDNKLFYKTQFSYQAGLYTKLFNRAKKALTAGLLFNYHLSKLQKENSNGGNHLASFGIQLEWLLKK